MLALTNLVRLIIVTQWFHCCNHLHFDDMKLKWNRHPCPLDVCCAGSILHRGVMKEKDWSLQRRQMHLTDLDRSWRVYTLGKSRGISRRGLSRGTLPASREKRNTHTKTRRVLIASGPRSTKKKKQCVSTHRIQHVSQTLRGLSSFTFC